MSIAGAYPKYCFGLKGDVANNVWYLDEQSILYPSGANLVLFNVDQKVQKFIPCTVGGEGMTALAVSPNKRYAAVAEKRSDKPTILVFDLNTQKRRKVLSILDITSQEFISLAFSPDSKYLITQTGSPDWILTYWHWEKAKVMAFTKSNGGTNYPVRQVSFNPHDNTQVCVIGEKVFKLFRYSEGNFKQFAFMKVEPSNYLCQAWLSEDLLVMGTDRGKVQLFEVGELKNEFEVNKKKDESSSKISLLNEYSEPFRIECITAYSKGFICSGGDGTLHFFEMAPQKYLYKNSRSISVWADPNAAAEVPQMGDLGYVSTTNDILNIALSPSEENVLCSTRRQQLYNLTLSVADLQGNGRSSAAFDYLTHSYHHGEITGMAVCVRKPLIATCSLDKSIRIWNYENNALDLYKEFHEEVYSIALHPSGLFVLVGFSEKLRLMNLLIDDIRPFKEFMIRGCRECCFSNGGHMFAAANATLIQLFSTYTYEAVGNLKGHNGKVRSMQWTPDDTKLISCSMDGAVYEWNVQACKREKECVLKTCSYTSLALTPDTRTTFAVGSDHTLKEIDWQESMILRQVNAGDVVLTQVVLSHSGRMLFVGTSSGTVRAVKFPLTEPGEWQEHQAHSGPVSKMCISYDNQLLFSVGQDGTLYSFKIHDKDGRNVRERDFPYADEMLISKSDLEEKTTLISELKTRVEELKMENEYQMRLKDMAHNEKTKELTDKFLTEIESLKAKKDALQKEMENEVSRLKEEISDLCEKQDTELLEIENANNQKLMAEYEKFQELQARSQKLQEDYERRILDMEDAKDKALQELTEHYEAKLHDKNLQLEKATDQHTQEMKESNELQRQTEEDADQEILDLKNDYERKLRKQFEDNVKLRGDAGILTKKVLSLQEDKKSLKGEIHQLQQEVKRRDATINSLKTDIENLKREIGERDDTIQDKEKRIYDLKKINQELEKYKFVLDYKIKEIRKQMEPRENEIKRMKEQIAKMEGELGEFSRDNKALQLAMAQKDLRLDATSKEMLQERQQAHDLKIELRNIKAGLHNTSRFIQEPKELKESIKQLYRKYLRDFDKSEMDCKRPEEVNIHSECYRHRDHLERTVITLKSKIERMTKTQKAKYLRIMNENVSLMKEINELRAELKKSRSNANDLEAILKIARKQGFDEHSARASSKPVVPLTGIAKIEPSDNSRIIEMQKMEISRLRATIREMESTTTLGSVTPTKLSPITTSLQPQLSSVQ